MTPYRQAVRNHRFVHRAWAEGLFSIQPPQRRRTRFTRWHDIAGRVGLTASACHMIYHGKRRDTHGHRARIEAVIQEIGRPRTLRKTG